MQISNLLEKMEYTIIRGDAEREITTVVYDS